MRGLTRGRCAAPAQAFRWVCAAWAAGAVLLSACIEGYPVDDATLPDPFTMSVEERLEALNALGSDAHPALRWRYTLVEDCTLRIESRSPQRHWSASSHDLAEVQAEAVFLADEGLHEVVLVDTEEVVVARVVLSERRIPALQARLLVQLLKRNCASTPPAGTLV